MAKLISVILPCRNERAALGHCLRQINSFFRDNDIDGEIIVSDSSDDGSGDIAKQFGAKLIRHNKKGYGIACIEGIRKATGRYIAIGDADGTYDFRELGLFISKLDEGYGLVIGSRFAGDIKKGSMPFLHRYIGNPLLSMLLNLFFRTNISDSNSGLRAISRKALEMLDLKTTGMEFASEMIIKASKSGLKVAEVPITYYPRMGKSKLKSISDGWRHLRFMLMFSPTYLFFIPGIFLFIAGFSVMALMVFGTVLRDGKDIGIYLSIAGALCAMLGYQVINLGLFSRIYAIHTGFEKNDAMIDFIAQKMPLERGITFGISIILAGIFSFFMMLNPGMGRIYYPGLILSFVIFLIGIGTVFSIFFISMMLVERRD